MKARLSEKEGRSGKNRRFGNESKCACRQDIQVGIVILKTNLISTPTPKDLGFHCAVQQKSPAPVWPRRAPSIRRVIAIASESAGRTPVRGYRAAARFWFSIKRS
jgi:hypothetical protein